MKAKKPDSVTKKELTPAQVKAKESYKRNKTYYQEYYKKYNLDNKEQLKEYRKEYYNANCEKLRLYSLAYSKGARASKKLIAELELKNKDLKKKIKDLTSMINEIVTSG